jgi:hypothetical protein
VFLKKIVLKIILIFQGEWARLEMGYRLYEFVAYPSRREISFVRKIDQLLSFAGL